MIVQERILVVIMTSTTSSKPVHTIILDTAPILLNQPPISTLVNTSEKLITTAAVVDEIRGEEARQRFETLYQPFIEVRSPKPESVKLVREFARKTGDLAVLSVTDLEVLALAYDLECERNNGDWRLRRVPGQKRVNGAKPEVQPAQTETETKSDNNETTQNETDEIVTQLESSKIEDAPEGLGQTTIAEEVPAETTTEFAPEETTDVVETPAPETLPEDGEVVPELVEGEESSSESDGGWITPSNIKKRQATDEGGASTSSTQGKTLQVATMTGDFAMQNVLLQMNLNLLSTQTCKRIANIKQTIFRCHACFATTKDMSKQFCGRCGKPTLTRVTCTTNDKGEVKLHLKQNFQWNNKGNVYSIPKPQSGTANQKWKGPKTGGGQGGWGNGLILAEDQKEYIRAMSESKRTKQKDLMDEDSLPSIFTGERPNAGGRTRVGAGRNVNSRKR